MSQPIKLFEHPPELAVGKRDRWAQPPATAFSQELMPSLDLFTEMLVWVPLNPLQSNWVSKNLPLNPFKLSLAQVDQK